MNFSSTKICGTYIFIDCKNLVLRCWSKLLSSVLIRDCFQKAEHHGNGTDFKAEDKTKSMQRTTRINTEHNIVNSLLSFTFFGFSVS